MFLPTESLYAEILRIPGLIMEIQNKYKVMLVGPNNLGAFLTSLQQGFKSLAIEKRTDEVWKLLGIVKTEFGKFGEILDKTQKKILEANNIIETAGAKSRSIERKLKSLDKINYLE
jgi:DNA recombination protein RmuC